MGEYAIEVLDASAVTQRRFIRTLLLGPPKCGKSTSVLLTCPKKAYVINSDQDDALDPAVELSLEKKIKLEFSHSLVQSDQAMEAALKTARQLVKERGIKTVIWDTMSNYSKFLLEQCVKASAAQAKSGLPDGRKYWPEYHKRLEGVIDRLFRLDAHVVVISHYIDNSSESDDSSDVKKTPKVGEGIVPMLGGQSRATIGRMFSDVMFLEKRKDGSRVFVTDIDGVWGPGCRSLPGVKEIPADVSAFIRAKEERMRKLMLAAKGAK